MSTEKRATGTDRGTRHHGAAPDKGHKRLVTVCGVLLAAQCSFLLSALMGLDGHWSGGLPHSTFLAPATAVAQPQRGMASFYSKRATGRMTSNGERLHHDSMTCAHRTYPFGTLLKVTNLSNGKSVVVRVTDRGPYSRGRIVDLSWGAAKAIGMLSAGIVPCTVEKVSRDTGVPFRPEEEKLELPEFDFAITDIAAGTTPVWQQPMNIDEQRLKQQMEQTAEDMKQQQEAASTDASPTSETRRPATATAAKPAPTKSRAAAPGATKGKKGKPFDELDEINNKQNTSKAYQKRNGNR